MFQAVDCARDLGCIKNRIMCILPPPVNPDCLTDEDSGDEDNVTVNNLPRNILLQPAEVYGQDNDSSSDIEEEPTTSQSKRKKTTFAWRKKDLDISSNDWPEFQGAFQEKLPIEWFENFKDEDIISLLVSESNNYAVKKKHARRYNCCRNEMFYWYFISEWLCMAPT